MMATELFAPHRLDVLHHLRREKVGELMDHVARLASDGKPVNVGRVAFTTSLNLLSRTIFSHDLTSLDDDNRSGEFQEVVTGIMETVGAPNVSDFFPVLAPADLQGTRRRLERLFSRLHVVFDAEMDERLRGRDAGQPRKNDFLDVLLDVAAHEDGKDLLDRQTLRSLFRDLFAAGSDTSSSIVEWAMTELLQNPSSLAKACNELEQVIGPTRNIEEADIVRLPYMQAIIKETFRLHPPAPLLLPRQPEVALKIAGYTIPKGSRIFVNVWAIGRDKDVWDEPEKFMPERFLLGSTIDFRGADFALLPFGAGHRICPGMTLATRMVHLILASLLHQFKWSLPAEMERDGIDMEDKFGLTLTKVVPLCILATLV
ncbi:unnamed protein product [Triticum turgidum subsp. durum]|uniref:Cytochrome P450 n=1 Tax=Triticum turgidum subsp. durum TaxID=4567 RepID=A0A9R1RUQ7_TRITD|nr:unnamed protein product [Triticum turgidum subsp. durum]